jgi:uncharacterized protein (TIGR03435 family)
MLGTAFLPLLSQSNVPKPSFEIALVKPRAIASGGRLIADNASLTFLIRIAYRVRDFQIIGGPAWMATDRWDVEAKAEERSVAPPAGLQDPNAINGMDLRLQSLLEDRFQLKLHHETRELPLYVLTVAKDGPKMRAVDPPPPFPDQAPPSTAPSPVGTDTTASRMFSYSTRDRRGQRAEYTANCLCAFPIGGAHTHRQNRSKWKFRCTVAIRSAVCSSQSGWSRRCIRSGCRERWCERSNRAIHIYCYSGTTGLKLESTRGPVDVLVVDSVQKPTEN